MLDGMLKSGDEPWGPLPSGVKVAGRFAEKNVLASFHPAVSGANAADCPHQEVRIAEALRGTGVVVGTSVAVCGIPALL